MAQQQFNKANDKLIEASDYLDELLDFSEPMKIWWRSANTRF
jgi:hypothetical protein